MIVARRFLVGLFVASGVLACGPGNENRPPADFAPPPPETADGEVVGADRQSPADKLQTGPTVGPGGVTPPASSSSSEPRKKPPPR